MVAADLQAGVWNLRGLGCVKMTHCGVDETGYLRCRFAWMTSHWCIWSKRINLVTGTHECNEIWAHDGDFMGSTTTS